MAVVATVKLLCVVAALLSFGPVSAVKTVSKQQGESIALVRREGSQTQKVQVGLGADGSMSDAFHHEANDMVIQATGFAFDLNSLSQAATSCAEGDVMMADSFGQVLSSVSSSEFVPWVRNANTWYPICGHYFWNNNNGATTFCQKLGFSSGEQGWGGEAYTTDAMPVGNCVAGEPLTACTAGGNSWGNLNYQNKLCGAGKTIGVKIKCSGGSGSSSSCSQTGQATIETPFAPLFTFLGEGSCRTASGGTGTQALGSPEPGLSIGECKAKCAAHQGCLAIEYLSGSGFCETHVELITKVEWTKPGMACLARAVATVNYTSVAGKEFFVAAEAWKAGFGVTLSNAPVLEYIKLGRNGVQVWAGNVQVRSHDGPDQNGQFAANWAGEGRRDTHSSAGNFQVGDVVHKAEAPDDLEHAFKEALVVEIQATDSQRLCTRTKMCELELVGEAGSGKRYTSSQKCQCAIAYWSKADTGSLDCTDWASCMDEHADVFFTSIYLLANKANPFDESSSLSTSLLQQQGGRQPPFVDLPDCNKDPYSFPECNCYAEMRHECKSRGITCKTCGAMSDCIREQLCKNANVCYAWKSVQCEGMEIIHDTSLAVSDIKEATKADVSHTAVAMHGRRQSSGNDSSSEPIASLDQSVSGKSCARSAR